jgi:heme-degrading monooxygenase HmoA
MVINVFTTPRERQDDLIATLGAIADLADSHALPRNIHSSFHRAIDAPIVVNYVQYSERAGALELANLARPLVDRTHILSSAHEMRWYDTVDVVTAAGDSDSFSVVAGKEAVAVIGTYVVDPGKRAELLVALKRYAESVSTADGFKAIAILQGQKPEHAATYEVWANDAAYDRATAQDAREAMESVRNIASDALVHSYEVVRVNRHKGAASPFTALRRTG